MEFKQKQFGFTIVELLIVVVIIAVLAGLVIVTFTGIQERAKQTKYQNDVATIIKKAEAYKTIFGSYPTGTEYSGVINYSEDAASKLPSQIGVYPVSSSYAAAGIDYQAVVDAANGTSVGAPAATYAVFVCSGVGQDGITVLYPNLKTRTIATTVSGTC